MRPQTFADLVHEAAQGRLGEPAIVLERSGLTYGELVSNGERRARQIAALGASPGDRIGILLPNSLEYVELVLGAAMIGVVVVPMNIRFKAVELRHLIVDSGMVALFTQSQIEDVVDFNERLLEALPGLAAAGRGTPLDLDDAPALRSVVMMGEDFGPFLGERDLSLAASLPPPPGPRDPLLLMYTSGTTAHPKGCVVPNQAIVSNAWAIIDRFAITEKDVWWCPLPMFHIGGLLFMMVMIAARGLYAGMTHFDPEAALDMLEETPPTIFYPLFPTITLALTEHSRFAKLDLSRVRYLFNLAPLDVQRRVQQALPNAPLMGAFGMTETCGTVAYGSPTDSEIQRLTTCGSPLSGWEVKILDVDTRGEVATGLRGEIAVRGVGLFAGYFNAPELTAAQFTADGFFLTGDIGSLDGEGLLSFHGRYKDQLKVGGENVSALEVESILAMHPAVNLAQVVGIADAKYGEVPAAYVEIKDGATLVPEDLIGFCAERIASFKVPRYVRIIDQWPMSATKIVKYRLKERLEAELNEQGIALQAPAL